MGKLEKDIHYSIKTFCKTHKLIFNKLVSQSSRGWPDIEVILPNGTVLHIELKTETGVVSPLQKKTIEDILRSNGNADVIRSYAEFRELLTRHGFDPTAARSDYRAVRK